MAKRTPMPSKTKCWMRGGVILFLCMTDRPRVCVPTQTRSGTNERADGCADHRGRGEVDPRHDARAAPMAVGAMLYSASHRARECRVPGRCIVADAADRPTISQPYLFVSYASADRDRVMPVVDALIRAGASPQTARGMGRLTAHRSR